MVDVKLFQALLAAARTTAASLWWATRPAPSVGRATFWARFKGGRRADGTSYRYFPPGAAQPDCPERPPHCGGADAAEGRAEDDFFLIESNGLACQKLVCDLVSTRLPKAYGFDPVRDIQVLCPTKVGPTGSVELNRRLQDILNPPAKGKGQIGTAESAKILRLGDKVMQVKNDYDITFERAGAEAGVGAFNGDLGIITAVDVDARSVTVQMDDKKYTYTADQLNELEPLTP